MSLLRTDQQAAINELHMAMARSVDHYADAAEFLQDESIVTFLENSARKREQFRDRVVNILDKLDDLPMTPDTDKQSAEQLMFHMEANVSADKIDAILQQRLNDEEQLQEHLKAVQQLEFDENTQKLLTEIQQHVKNQIEQIRIRLKT